VLDDKPDAWRFRSRTWFWTPKDTMAERAKKDRAPYVEWEKAGFIEAVPGPRVSYRWLAEALAGLVAEYDPVVIGCDQYGLERLLDQLGEIGATLPCVVHPQGFMRRVVDKKEIDQVLGETGAEEVSLWMPDSINKLEAALLEKRITVEVNPVMTSCAAGVVYEENKTGHRMFAKNKATTRIDGMVSLAMSIGVATIGPPKNRSSYLENDSLLVL
jgi:phage terminase large subunit-like protein